MLGDFKLLPSRKPLAEDLEPSGCGGKRYKIAQTNSRSRANCKHQMQNWRRSDRDRPGGRGSTILFRSVRARTKRSLRRDSQAYESSSRTYGSRNKGVVRSSGKNFHSTNPLCVAPVRIGCIQSSAGEKRRQCSRYATSWLATSATTLDQSQEGASRDLDRFR